MNPCTSYEHYVRLHAQTPTIITSYPTGFLVRVLNRVLAL